MMVAEIPVTNSNFTEEPARQLHRPAMFAIPGARLGCDFANELLLDLLARLIGSCLFEGLIR